MNETDTRKAGTTRVFLSYSQEDKETARYIADELRRSGVSTWFDEWELQLGDSLRQNIERSVSSSDYVLVLLSPASVRSDWVKNEITVALSRELKDRAIRLLPVLIEDCEIPLLLKSKLYLDLRQDRELGIQRLVAQLAAVPAVQFSELSPQRFEMLVGELLRELGFLVEAQSQSGPDSGFDFKAIYKSHDPFGIETQELWLVESRLYSNSRVSISMLRQVVGLLASSPNAAMGLVITSGNLTSEARRFLSESAYGSKIRVIEGPELMSLITRYPVLIDRYFVHGDNRA
jgi:hypothetical protein